MKRRCNLTRRFLGLFPEKIRLELLRRRARVDRCWPSPSLEIKIADTEEELSSAYRLLHDSYVKAGYIQPHPAETRVLPQHLLPQTTTIVGKWNGKVIATLSLIRDNPFGLPMEKIFDLGPHRADGKRLAEISSLALDPEFRGRSNECLFPLFRFVVQYARHFTGTHELVIAVNPSMVDLYLAYMCFERLGAKPKPYDFVQGAPAVGLYLDFETCDENWRRTFDHRPSHANFFEYWLETPHDPRNRLPKQDYHLATNPVLTPKLLKELFLDQARLALSLSFRDIQLLLRTYPHPGFQKVLQSVQLFHLRKNVRVDTRMKAAIGPVGIEGEVLNVSLEGLLLRTLPDSLDVGQRTEIDVKLNGSTSARLQGEVCWRMQNSLFGFRILSSTAEWSRMIQALEREFGRLAGAQ